jgi:hypothetical protein
VRLTVNTCNPNRHHIGCREAEDLKWKEEKQKEKAEEDAEKARVAAEAAEAARREKEELDKYAHIVARRHYDANGINIKAGGSARSASKRGARATRRCRRRARYELFRCRRSRSCISFAAVMSSGTCHASLLAQGQLAEFIAHIEKQKVSGPCADG